MTEYPSVSQTFVKDQILNLRERGHLVDVYAEHAGVLMPDDAGMAVNARTVYPAPLGRAARAAGRHPFAAAGVIRALKWGHGPAIKALRYGVACAFAQQRYDIVHCHFGPNGITGASLREAGVVDGALVVTFHGYDLSAQLAKTGDNTYAQLFRDVDLCLPVTERWRRVLVGLGCDVGRMRVHRMGIDCGQFVVAQRSGREDAAVRLVTVARLVEKKGVEYGIRAVAHLHATVPIHYTIIGEGPERAHLEGLIDRLGLRRTVCITGWRDRAAVKAALHNADIALLPSVRAVDGDEEGLPVFLMEAMATGLPTVASRHSGIPELLRDGVDGMLVPERDVTALADGIGQLARSPELRHAMGREARHRVELLHDQHGLIEQLVELYHLALTHRANGSIRSHT